MRVRVVQATTIVLFALVMGVFWGTWFSLSRSIAALVAATLSATIAAPATQPPSTHTDPPTRTVTEDQPA
jgi:hypothetical protein